MVRKAEHMKQRDLSDDCDGVHVPDSRLRSSANGAGTDRYEEPVAQESEDPYERRRRVMPVEQRGPGRWMG